MQEQAADITKVAVFDFDDTSIEGSSPSWLVNRLIFEFKISPITSLKIGFWGIAYKWKLPQNEAWVRGQVFKAFEGKPKVEVDRYLTEFYDKYIAKRFRPKADEAMRQGKTALIYTKRERLCFDDDSKEEILARSVKISEGVKTIVEKLQERPDFIIAKGGITSSDIATKAMGIKSATVAGQIKPGVPVWKSREDNRFKDIAYIIFPGNVGNDDTLKEIIEELL